jgi:hypothetical protein
VVTVETVTASDTGILLSQQARDVRCSGTVPLAWTVWEGGAELGATVATDPAGLAGPPSVVVSLFPGAVLRCRTAAGNGVAFAADVVAQVWGHE